MQYLCKALGLLSKKQYAPKAEIRFMIKLLTDLWRECTICAVFFSLSLMVSTLHARWSLKPWHQPIVPFPSVAIPSNTLLVYMVYLLRLWHTPEIMAYRYHGGIYECYASTSPESSQINPNRSLETWEIMVMFLMNWKQVICKHRFLMAVIRKSHLQKALYQAVTKTTTIKTILMTDLG